MEEQESRSSKKELIVKLLGIKVPLVAVILLFVLVFAGLFVAVKQNPQILDNLMLTQTSMAEAEMRSLVNEVGQLIELPGDEDPVIAEVTDVELLRDQQFFRSAQNGDRVLMYARNRKAILYRPNANRIIEVGMVSIDDEIVLQDDANTEGDDVVPSPTPAPTPAPVVVPDEAPSEE